MTLDQAFQWLGTTVVVSPAALLAVLGVTMLFGKPLSERAIARCTEAAVVIGLVSAVGILGLMLAFGRRNVPIEMGNWVVIPQEHFHFHVKFVFDRLSVPFAILTYVLVGTVGALPVTPVPVSVIVWVAGVAFVAKVSVPEVAPVVAGLK